MREDNSRNSILLLKRSNNKIMKVNSQLKIAQTSKSKNFYHKKFSKVLVKKFSLGHFRNIFRLDNWKPLIATYMFDEFRTTI
jgi:hypothetical protein